MTTRTANHIDNLASTEVAQAIVQVALVVGFVCQFIARTETRLGGFLVVAGTIGGGSLFLRTLGHAIAFAAL